MNTNDQNIYFDDGVFRGDFIETVTDKVELVRQEFVAPYFQGVDLLEGVVLYLLIETPGALNVPANRTALSEGFAKALNQFTAASKPIPADFDEFVDQIIGFISTVPDGNFPLLKQTVKDAFYVNFDINLGIRDQLGKIIQNPPNGDFSVLNGAQPPFNTQTMFDNFFKSFALSYPYNDGVVANMPAPPANDFSSAANFFKNLSDELLVVATLQPNVLQSKILNYKQVYDGLFPTTPEGFEERVVTFFEDQIQKKGYFIPSQALNEWVEELQIEAINALTDLLPIEFLTSVSGNDSGKVAIINRIIALVSEMVTTLQKVAASQAQQLQILTDLQKDYTFLQSQIPSVQAGTESVGWQINQSPSDLSKTPTKSEQAAAEFRQQVNTVIDQQAISTLQGQNQLEQNDAKQIQSFINQANDAVNQQSELASTLLQQLSSLLQSIYR